MERLYSWIKDNKLVVVLLLLLGYFAYKNVARPFYFDGDFSSNSSIGSYEEKLDVAGGEPMMMSAPAMSRDIVIAPEEFPPSASDDRLVIRDTSMSLQVRDVAESLKSIEQKAEEVGGYLVDSNVYVPEESASGSITIRVPEDSRAQVLESFRAMAVKVVSENVNGRDVTDQYEDIAAQLATHTKTKQKFEAILDQATDVQDILQVQRELVNVQRQIDNLVGRQQYLEQSARMSLISVYLSTDEFALPYTPDETWRPEVIFKQAVRSLVQSFRSLANVVIWLLVYSPIWIVGLVVVRWWMRRGK